MDPELCPPWWPDFIWRAHVIKVPGVGPINYPPAINDMMAALTIHTMSYMLLDRGAAQQVRTVAERQLVSTAQNLSKLHEQALSE